MEALGRGIATAGIWLSFPWVVREADNVTGGMTLLYLGAMVFATACVWH